MASGKAVRRNKSDGDTKPRLWSARICPYAERAIFSCFLLDIDYDSEIIDLFGEKPPRLLELNPLGKVPVIEDLGRALYESLIVVEYLDETWQSPSGRRLLPEKPMDRALAKMTADHINNKVIPCYYRIFKSFDEELEKSNQAMLELIKELDKRMRGFSEKGPYFTGDELNYVDISLMPHIRRLLACKSFLGFDIPNTPDYQRFLMWIDAYSALPEYKKLVADVTPVELEESMKKFRAILVSKR